MSSTIRFAKLKIVQILDRILHHRADPTNAMIGGDNSQTRSTWGEATDQDMLAPDLLPQTSWER